MTTNQFTLKNNFDPSTYDDSSESIGDLFNNQNTNIDHVSLRRGICAPAVELNDKFLKIMSLEEIKEVASPNGVKGFIHEKFHCNHKFASTVGFV